MPRDEHTRHAAGTRIPWTPGEEIENDPDAFADKLTDSILEQLAKGGTPLTLDQDRPPHLRTPPEPPEPIVSEPDDAPKTLAEITTADVHAPEELSPAHEYPPGEMPPRRLYPIQGGESGDESRTDETAQRLRKSQPQTPDTDELAKG